MRVTRPPEAADQTQLLVDSWWGRGGSGEMGFSSCFIAIAKLLLPLGTHSLSHRVSDGILKEKVKKAWVSTSSI